MYKKKSIHNYSVLIGLLFILNNSFFIFSQPSGIPPCVPSAGPGESACLATSICDLDGYCGRTLSSYRVDAWQALKSAIITCSSSGFDQLDINNDSYLKFVASSSSITFQVYVYDCKKPVTTKAIQLAIFSSASCNSGPVDVKYCNKQMNQQSTPHTVSLNNLTPGEVYYILIDGYSSQDCAYTFVATSGVLVGVSANINENTNLCVGESVNVTATGGTGSYSWTGEGVSSNSGNTVTITPPAIAGIYTYTINSTGTAPNSTSLSCPSSSEYEFTLTVQDGNPPTFNQISPVCEGTSLVLPTTSLNGIVGTWSPIFNSNETNEYVFTPNNTTGCSSTLATMTITVNTKELPVFDQIEAICSGDTFSLPSNSNNINTISGIWTPTINNTSTTTYIFTPNLDECSQQTQMIVPVNNRRTPNFESIGPFCIGAVDFVFPNLSNEGINGTWSPQINLTETTSYTFSPGLDECSESTQMTIIIETPLSPSFDVIDPICSGNNLILPSFSLENIEGNWTPSINNLQTTLYTFTPLPNNNTCNSLTSELEVIVLPVPIGYIEDFNICTDEETNIVLNANLPGTTFSWIENSINVIGANNGIGIEIRDVLSSTSGGNVEYIITPTLGECIGSQFSINVYVHSALPILVSPENSTICPGESVVLVASGADSYSWTPLEGLNSSNLTSVVASPLTTTNYIVTGTSTSGCVGTNSVVVSVLSGPTADFSPSIITGNVPLEVFFENNSSNSDSYFWDFGNGESSTSLINTNSTYNNHGTFEVLLIAEKGVCQDSMRILITVNQPDLSIRVPNIFTPNGDNINDFFFIEAENAKSINVEIFNRWGNKLATLESITEAWDGGNSPDGVYFYSFIITDLVDQIYEGNGFFHLNR